MLAEDEHAAFMRDMARIYARHVEAAILAKKSETSLEKGNHEMSENTQAQQAPATPVVRTSAGLRDMLFDELDALRNGQSNPAIANAKARIASGIVETVRMELEVQEFVNNTKAKSNGPLAPPIQLGAGK